MELEGVAVHGNSTAKRGQAVTVAGRSVTSSDLLSGHSTFVINERQPRARTIISIVMRRLTTFRSTKYRVYDGGLIRL